MRTIRDLCSTVIVAIPLLVLALTWKFLVVNGQELMAAAEANHDGAMMASVWRMLGYLAVMMLFAFIMERISRRVMSPETRQQHDAARRQARLRRLEELRRPPRRLR